AAGADADEHLDEVRAADAEERGVGLAGDGLGEEGLAGAGGADHEDAYGDAAAEFLEFLGIFEEINQLGDFLAGFLDAGDVFESDFVFLLVEHAGAAFAEAHGAFAGHFDLAEDEEINDGEDEEEGQEGVDDDAPEDIVIIDVPELAGVDEEVLYFVGHIRFKLELALDFMAVLVHLDGAVLAGDVVGAGDALDVGGLKPVNNFAGFGDDEVVGQLLQQLRIVIELLDVGIGVGAQHEENNKEGDDA